MHAMEIVGMTLTFTYIVKDSTKVFMSKPSAHCHSFVMTDLSGDWLCV